MTDTHPTGNHVLIVEDEEATRRVLALLLQRDGFTTGGAADGREALDLLRRGPRPALILLDLMMPGMCGREFRRRQRQDPALDSVPVVIVSAVAEVGQEAVALCASGYLSKPVEPGHLLATVRRVCGAGGQCNAIHFADQG
jgi:two-component system, chemotaxis family, chemotaxis protein CheY